MAKIVENAILVYTDGSLYPKGRRGGLGILFVHVDRIGVEAIVDSFSPPGVAGTTNNRMELQAAIEGLKEVVNLAQFTEVPLIVVRTDSRYVTTHFHYAQTTWKKNRWRNHSGRPIENADLWKELVRSREKIRKRVDFEWVKGHGKGKAKDPFNDAVDKLAKASAMSPLSKKVYRSSVRRKQSAKRTIRGSVEMQGQELRLRIVEMQWLGIQKVWKYRYEVTSLDSPFYENLDWIYSTHYMRDGHEYSVVVNDDTANPQIIDVIQEIAPKSEPDNN